MDPKKVLPSVTVSTEHYDIISSGSVVLQMGEWLEFEVERLRFRIVFAEDDSGQDGRVERSIVEEGTPNAHMMITFYNQQNAFFSSVPSLVSMATVKGKGLYLKFSVQSINNTDKDSDKIFFYTWYLDKDKASQLTTNASVEL